MFFSIPENGVLKFQKNSENREQLKITPAAPYLLLSFVTTLITTAAGARMQRQVLHKIVPGLTVLAFRLDSALNLGCDTRTP